MKSKISILVILVSMGILGISCTKVLDFAPSDRYDESVGYKDLSTVDKVTEGLYGVLYTPNVAEIRGTDLSDQFTDLIKNTSYLQPAGSSNPYFFSPNRMNPTTMPLNCWDDMYTRLPRINEFIVDINAGKLSHIDAEELRKREGEARFLRAFAFQELAIRYGRYVLRAGEDHVDDHNDRNKALLSQEEGWEYILSEFAKSAELLPEKWSGREGRVTKGAAWGMIARSALNAGKYDRTIEACNKVESMGYKLLDNYAEIFDRPNNEEIILAVNFDAPKLQHQFTSIYCPPGDYSKAAGTVGGYATPTEEFASAYEIKVDGKWQPFSWDLVHSGKVKDPYAGRDPRFYQTIFHNNEEWHYYDGDSWKPRRLQLYEGGTDGLARYQDSPGHHISTTGYIIRKYIREKGDFNFASVQSDQFWIEMRLAEIYLIHSEALARKGDMKGAYSYLNKLRTTRSTVQLTPIPTKGNWDEYLKDLSLERIRELGMEGHRFFDLRRWGKSSEVLNGKRMHGVEITPMGDGTFAYKVIDVNGQDRVWPERYNVHPIPKLEVDNNTLAEQHAQWK